jgi:cytidine deaminase
MNKTIQIMIEKAHKALENSYSPYSNFKVACCIQTETDTFFTGVNVENSSYSVTLCAEMSAIAQMVTSGHRKIQKLVIISGTNTVCPPCGACRQCIFEFSTPETAIYLCNKDSVLQTTIKELLPLAFVFNPSSGTKHD